MVHLKVHDLGCFYGAREVLQGISFQVNHGDLVGIIGPNGSGKSTLLKTVSRIIYPRNGQVRLQDQDLFKMSQKEVASQLAMVSQEDNAEFAFRVEEVVQMGRYPHLARFQKESAVDQAIVRQALKLTNTGDLAERLITEISGGEKQRVLLARALVQEPEILLLDEPTAHLDIAQQIEVLDLVARLRRSQGVTVLMVLHDLNLAAQYCDYLIMLHKGVIFSLGTPGQVLTPDRIREVYGSEVLICPHPFNHRPQVVLRPGGQAEGISAPVGENNAPSDRPAKQPTVHVVGGGGAARALLESLAAKGYPVTLGVVNVNDSDWERAKGLAIPTIESPPFSEIAETQSQLNLAAMQKAKFVILADILFGRGNLPNLIAVKQRAQERPGVLVINPDITGRDFTKGEASQLFNQLIKSGVKVFADWPETIQHLDDSLEEGQKWSEAN